jgi:hypothetical protein
MSVPYVQLQDKYRAQILYYLNKHWIELSHMFFHELNTLMNLQFWFINSFWTQNNSV